MNKRRITQEENPVASGVKTIIFAILTGIGFAIGLRIAQKKTRRG